MTPKLCRAVDQAIKSMQKKQIITQLCHKPFFYINTDRCGRSLPLFIHESITKNSQLNHLKFSINNGKASSVSTQTEKLMRKNLVQGHQMIDLCYCCKSKKKGCWLGRRENCFAFATLPVAVPFIYAG